MTLEMPSDPSGTPSGFCGFLDPLQEVSPAGDAYPLIDPSPGSDFVMDYEGDSDSSFEVVRDELFECARGDEPAPLVEVTPSPPPVATIVPISTFAPRMPTIFEEDEKEEEEDGDITVTPGEAQRALLPPDRFARPPSAPQVADAVDTSQDTWSDELDTPRPLGKSRFASCSSGYFGY